MVKTSAYMSRSNPAAFVERRARSSQPVHHPPLRGLGDDAGGGRRVIVPSMGEAVIGQWAGRAPHMAFAWE